MISTGGGASPRLRTPRLELRPLLGEDLTALHRHWTEPEVRRFLWDGRIIPPEQVEQVIETSARLFLDEGAGLWSLRGVALPELLGCAGFWYFHEPPQLELLVSLSAAYWGRGYAFEAASRALAYAFDVLERPFVQASTDAPNESSLRLMQRLGMRHHGVRRGVFGTIEIFRISRAAWQRRSTAVN